MTRKLITELSQEPGRDSYYSTMLYLEIEDGAQPSLEAFLADYPALHGLELEAIGLQGSFLDALRSLPYVISAESASYFYPFN